MTLRNWAIGYYIVEYEQDGSDGAEYGSHLLKNLEMVIDKELISKISLNTVFYKARIISKESPIVKDTTPDMTNPRLHISLKKENRKPF